MALHSPGVVLMPIACLLTFFRGSLQARLDQLALDKLQEDLRHESLANQAPVNRKTGFLLSSWRKFIE
jgi:hypothetical protein